MKIRLNKHWKLILKLVVSFGALAFVLTRIDLKETGRIITSVHPLYILLAWLLFLASKVIAAFRLAVFLRAIDILPGHIYNLKLYLLGMFYNLFLPGGIGGDGYKIYLLNKQYKVRTGKIFWAVFTDRLSGMLALGILAVVLSLVINLEVAFPYKRTVWILIPLGYFALWLFFRFFLHYFTRHLIPTSLLSLLVQTCQAVSAYFILLSLGVEDQYLSYIFLFLISSIVAMLPFTIGGMGARELTFLVGAGWMILDINLSVALSLLFYLITLLTSLGGFYYSLSEKWHKKSGPGNKDRSDE